MCVREGTSPARSVPSRRRTESFPLADIPLQEMITKAESGRYRAKPVKVFGFEEIVEAHRAMEQGLAGGKMVVAVN